MSSTSGGGAVNKLFNRHWAKKTTETGDDNGSFSSLSLADTGVAGGQMGGGHGSVTGMALRRDPSAFAAAAAASSSGSGSGSPGSPVSPVSSAHPHPSLSLDSAGGATGRGSSQATTTAAATRPLSLAAIPPRTVSLASALSVAPHTAAAAATATATAAPAAPPLATPPLTTASASETDKPPPPQTPFDAAVSALRAGGFARAVLLLEALLPYPSTPVPPDTSADSANPDSDSNSYPRADNRRDPNYNWLNHASILNNLAVANRNLSRFHDALIYISDAWNIAITALANEKLLLDEAALYGKDDWISVLVDVLDLEKDEAWIGYIEAKQRGIDPGIPIDTNHDHREMIHGPPATILFLDLTTNYANIHFSLGNLDDAIEMHSRCLRLAEYMLELFLPIDGEFRMCFPLSIQNRLATAFTGQILPSVASSSSSNNQSQTQPQFFAADNNMPTPPRNKRIHLSLYHKSLIFAQARSLASLAACFQTLGLDEASLQCNSHANAILAFYREFAVFGGLTPAQKVSDVLKRKDTSQSTNSTDDDSSSNSTATTFVNNNNKPAAKKYTRMEEWTAQAAQQTRSQREIDFLRAGVLSNLAASLYVKGRLPAAMDAAVDAARLFHACHNRHHRFYEQHHQKQERQVQTWRGDYMHALAHVYALKVEVGRNLKAIHWIRSIQFQGEGRTDPNICTNYWGPPRLAGINPPVGVETDVFADVSLGAGWVDDGVRGLKECLKSFQESDDLMGM
ncbi:hypothetical protein HK100_008889, partial [Physocladia obscura]